MAYALRLGQGVQHAYVRRTREHDQFHWNNVTKRSLSSFEIQDDQQSAIHI